MTRINLRLFSRRITRNRGDATDRELLLELLGNRLVLREPVQDGPDGRRTAGRPDDLMIEHGLGVSVAVIYHLKRIDSDFFSED